MEDLEKIIRGYKDLFFKTGRTEFFMIYRGLERINLAVNSEKLEQKEENLTL